MSSTSLGIARFDASAATAIQDWLDQFTMALLAAGTKDDIKKAVLLTHLSPSVFKAVKTSLLPQDIMSDTVTLGHIKAALLTFYHKPPNKAMARVNFSQITQQPAEPVAAFAQRL